MFDKEDPLSMSVVAFVVFFLLAMGIFYLAQPTWVKVIDSETGKPRLCWKLVISYSVAVGFFGSVITMLYVSSFRQQENKLTYEVETQAIDPKTLMAFKH